MKMELRVNPTKIVANEDGSMTVSGYVNKTNKYSELLGSQEQFREKITPGAFERAVTRAKEIHFLAEHDNSKILASTRNSSLNLTEDSEGLLMEATICPTSWGQDYYQLINSGILQNMSFGFRAIKDAWKRANDGYLERTVEELDLFEVSVVRDPAYPQSMISARGIDLVEDVIPADIKEDSKTEEKPEEQRMLFDVDAFAEQVAGKIFALMNPDPEVNKDGEEDTNGEESELPDGDDDEEANSPNATDLGPTNLDPEEETIVTSDEEEEELNRSEQIKQFVKRFR